MRVLVAQGELSPARTDEKIEASRKHGSPRARTLAESYDKIVAPRWTPKSESVVLALDMILRLGVTRIASLLLVSGVFSSALLAQPSDAHATSCFASIEVAWPEDGGTLPLGSFVYLDAFCGASVEGLEVTVDGEAAALVPGPAYGAYELSPEPAIGAVVSIEEGTALDEELGEFVPVSFEISEAVESSLESPELGLGYGLTEDFIEGTEYWGLTATVIGAEANAGRPVFYTLAGPNGATGRLIAPEGTGSQSQTWNANTLPPAGTEVCVTVSSIDVHGAEAADVTKCITAEPEPEPQPECDDDPNTDDCDTATSGSSDSDTAGETDDGPADTETSGNTGDDPVDTDGDPGGTQGDSADPGDTDGDSGGGSNDDSGSGCNVAPGAGGSAGVLALLLLAGMGRRRQRA